MLKRLRFILLYGLYCCAMCAGGLLLLEVGLRLFTDRPLGLFDATPLNHTSLYHPSSRIPMELMAIPYVIETNALGFRGPEIGRKKPSNTIRIIALGDSITDGYLVDNEDTYPVRLQEQLRADGYRAEVINAARGGSTIDREYWILHQFCAGLSPDIVVLTFVGNDIYELGSRDVETLLHYNPEPLAFAHRAAMWATRSAAGEWLLDRYFAMRFAGYRGQGSTHGKSWGAERYDIPGATDYGTLLPEARKKLQSLKLHLPVLEAPIAARADAYLAVLKAMRDWCEKRDIQLVWVWFSTFVQTYGDTAREPVYDYLLPSVSELGIPVIDVVPAFRRADRNTPLYLAPVDYHLTPAGNQLLAETIGHGLIEHGILGSIDKEVE